MNRNLDTKGNRAMIVRYWQPWREMGRDMDILRRQMDRLFEDLTETNGDRSWTPAIELKDAGDTLVLRVQLPGVEAKDLDIQVTQEMVTIAGESHHPSSEGENRYYRSEFRYGKFQRVVELPVAVDNSQVRADYKDGILNLTLPKLVESGNKAVKINLAELNQA
jgi:HSP20 family protein